MWLEMYDPKNVDNLSERVYWYAGMNLLLQIKRSYLRNDQKQTNFHIAQLKNIYKY
jgi:hypothetical protein